MAFPHLSREVRVSASMAGFHSNSSSLWHVRTGRNASTAAASSTAAPLPGAAASTSAKPASGATRVSGRVGARARGVWTGLAMSTALSRMVVADLIMFQVRLGVRGRRGRVFLENRSRCGTHLGSIFRPCSRTLGTHSVHPLGAHTWGAHWGHRMVGHTRHTRHTNVVDVGRSPPGPRLRASPQRAPSVGRIFVEIQALTGGFTDSAPECAPRVHVPSACLEYVP